MSFVINFATEFFSFKVDLKTDKYLSNTFDLIVLMQYDEVLGLKIENEDKENIENLGACSFLSKKSI